eukprot:GEMP01015585.1.p1 GENE.GEMP01015585.1~~GEMP01015585.1.p1  ORF type:complete len:532 (-),score=94.19 GEMP01015585.1:691-2286(-)
MFLRPVRRCPGVRYTANTFATGVVHTPTCTHVPSLASSCGGRSSSTCSAIRANPSKHGATWAPLHAQRRLMTTAENSFPDLTVEKDLEERAPSGMEGWDFEELIVSAEDEEVGRLEERLHGATNHHVPPPIEDKDLVTTNVRSLERGQFIWFVGRVATKRIDNYNLWESIDETVMIMQNLEPSEVTRLLQAYAYGPKNVATTGFEKLLTSVPANCERYKDEQIVRLLYALCKRGASFPKQLDFFLSEVLERLTKMRGHQLLRVASALEFTPGVDTDMLVLLSKQIITYATTLDAQQFAKYVRLVVKLNLHSQAAMIDKLNTVYKKKLRRWTNPQWILESGMPLFLYDIMKTSTLTTWLQQLSFTRLPIEGDNSKLATANLSQMMIVDLALRHDRTVVLNDKAKRLLERVRNLELQPQETKSLYELPFVFADLVQHCEELQVLLHPVIVGPYYLELADPLTKRVVEWDRNWEQYPPYRRFEMQDYATRKHRYLEHMGWTTIKIPLHHFYGLDALAQRAYLHQFINDHKLPRE